METKLQALTVNIIRECFKTRTIRGGWESIGSWNEASIFIQGDFAARNIAMRFGFWLIPFDVHDDVLPTEFGQMLGHIVGVRFHFIFANGRTIGIPAVPSHRRSWCEGLCVRIAGEGYACRTKEKQKRK